MNIEQYLNIGKENAKSRAALIVETGMDDRTIRLAVEDARKRQIPVMPDYQNGGYFIAACNEETMEYRRKQKAKGLKEINAADRTYVLFGQIGIASSWR